MTYNGGMALGRKKLMTPENRKRVIECLQLGCSKQDAADYISVSIDTIQREEKADESFAASVKKATVECKMFHLRRVREGDRDWVSSAWMLERKWYKEYSKHAWDMGKEGESVAEILRRLVSGKNATDNGDTTWESSSGD